MASKRVLILKCECLPSAGLQSLLSNQDDIHVQAATFTNSEELLKVIDTFQPDAIVMFEDMLEKYIWALAASLKEYPGLRAIIMHWDNNEIRIHDSQKVMIKEISDFLAAL